MVMMSPLRCSGTSRSGPLNITMPAACVEACGSLQPGRHIHQPSDLGIRFHPFPQLRIELLRLFKRAQLHGHHLRDPVHVAVAHIGAPHVANRGPWPWCKCDDPDHPVVSVFSHDVVDDSCRRS